MKSDKFWLDMCAGSELKDSIKKNPVENVNISISAMALINN